MTISRSRSLTPSLLAAATILLAASGCRDKDPERSEYPKPVGEQPGAAQPNQPAAPEAAAAPEDPDLAVLTITAVDIDTKLAALCGIPATQIYFKYDSANLGADAKDRLDRIATCATTGPAAGRELLVVGRADPVGSDAYNQQLGMTRAAAVGEHLRKQGVQKQRVELASKGEQGASPHPWRWPEARRVTVRLAD